MTRLIEYKKAQRIFLDSIVSEINRVISIASEKIKVSGYLEIKGIPTVDDYDKLKNKLKDGKISFKVLFDKIL
ncbi:hypothetical protein MM221_20655 [Salipaludibacillus sp. LMS25]|uniref:hypothetical protein n=1 Tax=Salipaludibacillus sp. LMS25 TaxID=2924031 RepID=UPI0020D0FCBA|nr:hypothetical protein [Salipaludibacillus sp. LMS25]UTR14917.1 hypothetical protein MM221_20655 [Salipaludibacillus sp. LMS25]